MALTDTEKRMLGLEAQAFLYLGVKQAIVRETFGLSFAAYQQRLQVLINRDDAEEYAPALVRRLRRLRDARAQARGSWREAVGLRDPAVEVRL